MNTTRMTVIAMLIAGSGYFMPTVTSQGSIITCPKKQDTARPFLTIVHDAISSANDIMRNVPCP